MFLSPDRERGYPIPKIRELMDKISAVKKVKFTIFWGPSELKIMDQIKSVLSKDGILIEDVPFQKILSLMRRLNLFICCDTGTNHLASMADIAMIVLVGATMKEGTEPWGTKFKIIKDKDNICKNINVNNVFDAVLKQLNIDTR